MRDKWFIKYFFGCLVLLAGVLDGTRATAQGSSVLNERAPKVIPGQYIVVFKPVTRQAASKPGTARQDVLAAEETVKRLGGTVGFTYTSAVIGFSAKLPPQALEAVRTRPGVAYIEADQVVSLNTVQPPNPPGFPPLGLDRIDRRLLPLNNTYTYSETGAGVHVYVIDSGIWTPHTDFGGRASGVFTAVMDGHGTDDCNGHGTHVAGIIGGTTNGVAKQVTLHAVRVTDCTANGALADTIAGVDWVTMNAIHPAVANMSLGTPSSPTLDTAVKNSIAMGITYVVAAGNQNDDACFYSPAEVPAAITVGATNPIDDSRDANSNFGTCLKLFAPGMQIESAMPDGVAVHPGCILGSNTPGSRTQSCSGTSVASPHVAGVAARYLETHMAATPAAVWTAIHAADDVFGVTPMWPGVGFPGAGSPNELLHYGSLNDGLNDGDPHLTTVEGVHYDFQSAGEFVSLRDSDGLEIQTRQTPVPTASVVGPNAHTGLTTCVSLNTAVAAHVGKHRVSYEPNLSGVPDPSGLQLRVDGTLTTLGPNGLDFGDGSRIVSTAAPGGLEFDFPDETALVVTPGWWAPQGRWYLNVDVSHTRALEGILGAIPQSSWLPALPDGSSMGPMPGPLHDRFVDLYQKFADAWRVTDKTSLFDYASGTSTGTFTMSNWPPENPPCTIPHTRPIRPASRLIAQRACRAIRDENTHANCVFDVIVTGNPGFAKTYLLSQRIKTGSTTTTVTDDRDPTRIEEPVTFTATVTAGKGVPTGAVQFTLDGYKIGRPLRLDSKGQAIWKTSSLKPGKHKVTASYIPSLGSVFLPSTSPDEEHTVRGED
ncbi:MAG TPA: S8 family serine peptidase [Terriglobales bacterium]|nr:S8 family serine peptidase [Terriglobales bacterium]